MLARDVHDHIVGGIAKLLPVVLAAKLLGMNAQSGSMRFEMLRPNRVIDLFARIEESVERTFGVDDQLAPARKPDDHIRSQATILGCDGNLGFEIGISGETRLLEHVAKAL